MTFGMLIFCALTYGSAIVGAVCFWYYSGKMGA